ncbi:nucleotide disphospho-sugar-binding domain-containing protein [Kitasatospora sp. GP82]|uniref:nucleotide disphospho-sugar-binding domain-containing protein n=1 Tax=Kitasatospora sp. GP82 TaxID=3035089 RepID=UPI002473543E|nr:nucleotide disphospho-sugar-binding domain-containing protein [Kitasatospora sp. GP82]MDH6128312.1 UDP:flavonoid glycosyltransferase YjiC (YdhE family) [Kitasatospora sp. GP82]
MRVLFTGPGSAGHLFPMVPTAQALRSAGHQVLFAGSPPIQLLRNTGLPIVEIGDGSTVADSFRKLSGPENRYVADGRSEEEIFKLATLGFADHSRTTIDSLSQLATDWRPDIVVYDSFQAAAPLVAAKLGVPHVVHNFGIMSGLSMVDRIAEILADDYRVHGLTGPTGPTVIDVVPPSLGGDGTGWRTRYVPYNGGGTVPADLTSRRERPRISVTLGTVLTEWDGVRAISWLTEQAGKVDADFLLAVGDADLGMLGDLPANVRPLPWVPLAELLDASDAIVHHGGSGTMLTAAAAGIPQLILPQGADHFINAGAAEAQGFALRSASAAVDADLLTRLLDDQELRRAATALRAEINELPSPAALVADFEQLHRDAN